MLFFTPVVYRRLGIAFPSITEGSSDMEFKYGLDERPAFSETLLYGLQWFAVTIPTIIVIGKITGEFHFGSSAGQLMYLQKLMFVMAVALAAQLMVGHRMPLIVGPSSILLVGIITSSGHPPETIYTSIFLGGLLLVIAGATGLLGHFRKLFSPRVIAVVLILIAFTLTPTLVSLMTAEGGPGGSLAHLLFSLVLVSGMFAAHRYLSGIWKSTLIVWSMAAGSLAWFLMFPEAFRRGDLFAAPLVSGFFSHLTLRFSLDAGVLASFLVCFLALFINDLGSIQSMNELLKPEHAGRRLNRGILITGFSNILSGVFGVIGPVNFSLSPGVIIATGCASRIAMLPNALLLFLLSFSPAVIAFFAGVPSLVVGAVMTYILSSQIAGGLLLAFESLPEFRISDGLVIGLPLLLATVIAFLPPPFVAGFPSSLRPVLGNGFVVGITAALLLDHWIFRD